MPATETRPATNDFRLTVYSRRGVESTSEHPTKEAAEEAGREAVEDAKDAVFSVNFEVTHVGTALPA